MSIPTILVIEDSLADVFLIRHVLDELGESYRLEVLHDGEAALSFVAEHRSGVRKHEPCVILLDLNLPKYNGLQVLTAIREEPALSHIHVVVLTSVVRPEERAEIEELGGICCIKPSDLQGIESLASEIMALCKGRAQGLAVPTV
ncbi:MAG: response regulator receiver protein [Bryobacterales bacterium]|nr:response regulator receiver protein [Bryobacterales bacterium]